MSNTMTARVKNQGANPRILYDVNSNPVMLKPGETKPVELRVREVQRIRHIGLQGGSLVVINASEIPSKRIRIDPAELEDNTISKRTERAKGDTATKVRTASGKPAKPKESVIRPEIKTPQQLLAAMSDGDPLQYNHFLSVAFRVLPPGTLRVPAKKADVWKALEAAARKRP